MLRFFLGLSVAAVLFVSAGVPFAAEVQERQSAPSASKEATDTAREVSDQARTRLENLFYDKAVWVMRLMKQGASPPAEGLFTPDETQMVKTLSGLTDKETSEAITMAEAVIVVDASSMLQALQVAESIYNESSPEKKKAFRQDMRKKLGPKEMELFKEFTSIPVD